VQDLETESSPELEVSDDMTPAEELEDTESPEDEPEEAAESTEEPEEGEETDEPETPEEPSFTVTENGKERTVTLEELKAGFLRNADYTQKTQALARLREENAARAERLDQALMNSEGLIRAMHEDLTSEFQNVDWAALAEDNPAEYVAKRAKRDLKVERIQAAIARHQQLGATRQQDTQAMTEAEVAEVRNVLKQAVPEWRDEAKLQAGLIEVREHLAKQGYSKERLMQMRDPLDVLNARKAMLYDKLQAKVPKATKASKAPPVVTKAPSKGVRVGKDPHEMTDAEYAAWRRKQIAQRRP